MILIQFNYINLHNTIYANICVQALFKLFYFLFLFTISLCFKNAQYNAQKTMTVNSLRLVYKTFVRVHAIYIIHALKMQYV